MVTGNVILIIIDRVLDAKLCLDRLLDAGFFTQTGEWKIGIEVCFQTQTGVMLVLISLTGGLVTGSGLTTTPMIGSLFGADDWSLYPDHDLVSDRRSEDRRKVETEVWILLEIDDQVLTGDWMAPVTLVVIISATDRRSSADQRLDADQQRDRDFANDRRTTLFSAV
jgi:hypothetical protein